MKKIFIIGLIIVMIAFMSVVTFALEEDETVTNVNDSLNISDKVKHQLNIQDSERVIKIYNVGSLPLAFAEVNNIEELLEKDYLVLSEYYAIQTTDDKVRYKDIVDNRVVDLSVDSVNQVALKAMQSNKIATKISSDIEVYETYYLSGETSYSGTAIYYKTNIGDYVYYNHYALENGEYLFPIKDFCEYQKAVLDEMRKNADLDGGVDIGKIWDLSKYRIYSDIVDMNPAPSNHLQSIVKWSILGVIVVTAALITFIGIYTYRKKHLNK